MRAGRAIGGAGIVLALLLPGSAAAQAPGPECLGRGLTIQGSGPIVGTPGRDVIAGSPGADVIRGGGGRDIICGRGGGDKIVGGPGPDAISGGGGRDLVVGDGGTWTDKRAVGGDADTLVGNGGADVIIGDAFSARGGTAVNKGGRDRIVGNDGRFKGRFTEGDLLIGGSVSRSGRVVGRDGTDTLRGAGGPDLIIGDNARLSGGPSASGQGSDDLISGGDDDDDLVGGGGEDECFGRGGLDSFTACETEALSCPRGAADGIDPEVLIGARLDRARRIARNHDGCTIRVVPRDGQSLPSDDRRSDRINVAVRNGRISRIIGVF
jgi:hemolysin type calcium-binding protein